MAKRTSSLFRDSSNNQKRKKTLQGLCRVTKWVLKGSKRYKKKPKGQGK